MGEAGERALTNDFRLAKDLPDEVPDALAEGKDMKAGVFPGVKDFVEDGPDAEPESDGRGHSQAGEKQLFKERKVLGFSQGWKHKNHRHAGPGTGQRYRMGQGVVAGGD
jgi:hypothetical protein